MARKFPEKKTRSTDRGGTVRRANESRGRPAPARSTPSRVSSPLRERMASLRGGGGGAAPSRDPRQGAIDFGRQMTGGGGTQQAVDAIRSRVMQQLAGRGISQDNRGSYQIAGMERNDPSLAIRDMAVRGMGGPSWEQVVAGADARLRQPGGTSGLGMPNVPNGATMADDIIRGMPTPGGINQRPVWEQTAPAGGMPGNAPGGGVAPVRSAPGSLGGLVAGTQPGLSAPPMPSPTPRTGPTVIGGMPGNAPGGGIAPPPPHTPMTIGGLGSVLNAIQVAEGNIPPPSNGFPPQGQGVGRTTTPTGAQVDPSKYPVTNTLPQGGMPGNAPGGGMAPPPRSSQFQYFQTPDVVGSTAGGAPKTNPGVGDPLWRMQPQTGGAVPVSPPVDVVGSTVGGAPKTSPGVGDPLWGMEQSRQNFQAPSAPQQGIMPNPQPTTPVSSGADVGMMGSVLGSMERSRQSQPLHGLFGGTGQTPTDTTPVSVIQPQPTSNYPGLGEVPGNTPGGTPPIPRSTNQQGLTYQPYSQQGGMPGNAPGGGVAPPIQNTYVGPPGSAQSKGIYGPPGGPPISPVMGGPTSLDRSQAQQGNIGAGTGGQVIGSGIGQQGNIPGAPTGPAPNPNYNPPTSFPSQGQGVGRTSIPTSPGGGTTPVVPPGALPGNTTPSRPGVMPSVFPNGGPFGSPGPTPIPGFPSAGMPGGKDLSQLGAQIQQTVASRTAGIRGQARAPVSSPENTAMAGLAGLGDRIRQSVMSAQGGAPGIPGVGTSPGVVAGPDLSGLGASIMERVRSMTQMPTMSQMPTMGQIPGPGTGQALPGAPVPPGGAPPLVPGPSTSPMPTGTGALGAGGGRWAPMDKYNASFEAAGAEFGVPPEILKGMAAIESGWAGDAAPCRDDGFGDGDSCGMMQVKGAIWDSQIGCDTAASVDCNIRAAAMIMKKGYDACGNWDCALTSLYFPQDDPNGTTQGGYLQTLNGLVTEQGGFAGGPPATSGTQVLPTNAPQQIDPATGAPIQATPVTGALGGTSRAPATGGMYTPGSVATGAAAPSIDTSESGVNTATNPMTSTYKPQFIVYHITDGPGYYGAVNTYDQDGDGVADGASNYVIDPDGVIHEIVAPGSAAPVANGGTAATANPQKNIVYQAAQQGMDFNQQTVSIEMVATQGGQLTPQQIAAGQALTAYLSGQYSIPMDDQHLVGHSDINSASRGNWDPYGVYSPMDMVPQGVAAAPTGGTTTAPSSTGGVFNTVAMPAGQASNGQPTSSIDAQSTAWADALTPGGSQMVVGLGYGFGDDQGQDLYGAYNHTTWPCSTCHPGVDVPTNGSQPYNSLTGGTVTCVGGQSSLGSGGAVQNGSVSCGAYADEGGGVGNVSVLKDDGALIVYGHSRSISVPLGSRVQAGQPLGMSGSNGGYHVHEEVQLPIGPGGAYTPVDPDLYYGGYYCGQGFCPY